MGTNGKQGLTTPLKPAQEKITAQKTVSEKSPLPANVTPLRDDMIAATSAFIKQTAYEKRSYLKSAIANPYNISLFAGGLAAAGLTLNPFLAVLVVCLEVLWVVNAPGSKFLQRVLWDPQFEKQRETQTQQDFAARMQNVSSEDRDRVTALIVRQQEINQLASQNPSFTGELLRIELGKTDRLVDEFVNMAITCGRYEAYLSSIDFNSLDRDRKRFQSIVQGRDEQDAEVDIARKNLAIIMKRFDKMKEIRHYLVLARGQLDLIENSFQLIADQIVTMQSPQELTGQLDELLDGVESIKQTAADTERLLNPLGLKDLNI